MSIFKRVMARHDSTSAALSQPDFASQCVKFRTRSGRLAHWVHADYGVLCGQSGASFGAEPGLDDCRLCEAELAKRTKAEPGEEQTA